MTTDEGTVVAYEPSLGRLARTGSWEQLAKGTYRAATEQLAAGNGAAAAQLVEVAVLEADELRDIYERWPAATTEWILGHGVPAENVTAAVAALTTLIGEPAMEGIEAQWPQFTAAVATAATTCRRGTPDAADAIEHARVVWQGIHDRAVDRVAGLVDIATRLVGEDSLGGLWDFLMDDWYEVHARRYALTNQPWSDSAHQLMVAIVDGFHAHLTGTGRTGDIEIIDEPTRMGFRFAPCGSGGRSLDPRITDGAPRSGEPFGFAVTTEPHDWAWNTVGICSYCVHCCQLNEVMPIDRLGYPTRVIDAPTWDPHAPVTSCTWWVYRDPADVPDYVYRRVGRDPGRRPARNVGAGHD
ncbi:hypothetical protein [Mycolicibacterium brisbanense]|uniref:Uncharacterized protein n=1 Tax=Mycolicibacterium brisbanense TaxID=146020 RepID=A0A117I5Y4_9MYCO|nr:hypothetical protein [Mycolicibacterium brisbanense]MCV7161701.1 hypothetical protein [Mycolicibacterium brisbanense]GAS89207.1 uncharacterized protein RMCB_3303 [Mycolicibacterium brisbanense]